MKINPLSILINKDFEPNKNLYFISGNEVTLIEKIKSLIINKYQEKHKAQIINIDTIKNFVDEVGLFENKKIFLVNNFKSVDEKSLENIKNHSNIYIFVQENSSSIKKIKNFLNKYKDCYLVDCYDLDRDSKILILNNFINDNKINISKEIYWLLIEKLDNKYIFLENNLQKILGLDEKSITLDNIKKLLTIDVSGKEKVFFNLLKTNREIIEIYRNKILNNSDVNDLYYYGKFFCQLIIDSKDIGEYQKKIPVYLFREKSFLIDVYRKYNSKKKKLLIKLLSKTEKVLRKESSLSLVSGLRFLLNIKKITIS